VPALSGGAVPLQRLQVGSPDSLLRVPGYPWLFTSSLLWHTARWGGLFTTSYLVTALANSPILTQVAGALLFVPMLVGGLIAGAISDRFERRRMVLTVQAALVPVELGMFLAVHTGVVRVWMAMPFMFALGIGGLVNMTAQRPLIYEMVGPRHAPAAMAIESTAQAGSSMIGTLLGGVLISRLGLSAGFAGMAGLLCISLVLLWLMPDPDRAARQRDRAPESGFSVRSQLATSAGLVRRSELLRGTLGITIVMNILLVLFGVVGFTFLGVRDYPAIDPPNVSVRTNYSGANADIIESQITEPLEKAINGIAGIKNITSSSSQGSSNINVEFDLGIELEAAANVPEYS